MKNIKIIGFVLVVILLSASCVSTKKYSSFVKPKFEELKDSENSKNITFDLSKLDSLEGIVKAEKLKSQFIPAILFWQWENNIKCQICPQSVGNMFKSDFIYYSESLGLSDKLGNRNLKIGIEEIPSSFIYINKGYTIIFIVAYTISQLEAIYPDNYDFVIKYEIQENGQENISGDILKINRDVPLQNTWSTTKKFTQNYVLQFENNINEVAKETVLIILNKLEQDN